MCTAAEVDSQDFRSVLKVTRPPRNIISSKCVTLRKGHQKTQKLPVSIHALRQKQQHAWDERSRAGLQKAKSQGLHDLEDRLDTAVTSSDTKISENKTICPPLAKGSKQHL